MTEAEVKEMVEKRLVNGKGFDPFTIITIITIIWKAYQLWAKCKLSKELAKNNVRRNGLASRLFLKKQVYDKLVEQNIDSDKAYQLVEDLKKEFLRRD